MKLVFLCPQQSDVERLSYLGMDAVHASHSAFIDETIFFPDPAVEKTFTAVINANMAAWKRHELAWGVERLALITYLQDGQTPAAGIAGYQSLAFSNRTEDGGVIGLTAQEVAAVLRKSWCGLMLSELEGANFASAEYLFCGLPLVTTPSRGGRHALYSSRYVKVVAPRTEAVATGVALAQDWPVPPEVIHAEVLARCIPHRRRLLDWLSRVMEKDAHAMANQNAWLPSYRDKLREVFVL
jgi:glycosyltransferase involved in cell wall biosynthesis